MNWMLMPLHRYADFSGRSRRKEYWMFALAVIIAYAVAVGIDSMIGTGGILVGITALGLIVPSIAVAVRRFHDQDKSGWFVLLNFIPLVGGIIVLVFMCLEGTKGDNNYGADPKGQAPVDTFS